MRYQLLAMTVILSFLQPLGAAHPGALGTTLWAQGAQPAPRTEAERQRAVNQLAFERSLNEAARANGGTFTVEYDMNTAWRVRPRNVQEMVDSSPLIVVGTVQSAGPRPTRDGRMIETVYSVVVTDTLKGDPRSAVTVRIPGGRVAFPDGAVAEVLTPGFALQTGGTYALFLRPAPTGVGTDPDDAAQGVQVLSVGPQGVIDVSRGRVQSLARPDNAIRAQHDGRDAKGFLQDVRAQARRAVAGERQEKPHAPITADL